MTATGRVKSSNWLARVRIRSVSRRSASMYSVAPASVLVSRARAWSRHDGVVVHVDDPGFGGDGLGDLVGVARRGDAGADVQELADRGPAGSFRR